MVQNTSLYGRLLDFVKNGTPAIVYTLIDGNGYPGMPEGGRLLLAGDEKYGSLGLPQLDERMLARAGHIFSQSAPSTDLIEVDTAGPNEEIFKFTLLEDLYFPQKKLIIFGGGHVAQPLAEIASILGFVTVVIDDRADFVSTERFPRADKLICASLPAGLPEDEVNSLTSVVIITRGHQYDRLCLKSVIHSKACYIGMIGSSGKVRQTFQSLMAEGISKKTLEKVSAPIGLDLGGQKPGEIALSILAEIVAHGNEGSCKPMKYVKAGVLA